MVPFWSGEYKQKIARNIRDVRLFTSVLDVWLLLSSYSTLGAMMDLHELQFPYTVTSSF